MLSYHKSTIVFLLVLVSLIANVKSDAPAGGWGGSSGNGWSSSPAGSFGGSSASGWGANLGRTKISTNADGQQKSEGGHKASRFTGWIMNE